MTDSINDPMDGENDTAPEGTGAEEPGESKRKRDAQIHARMSGVPDYRPPRGWRNRARGRF